MKHILFVLSILMFASYVQAHEYFFAFAEVEYNTETQRFEIAIQASKHDVEDVMNASGISIKELGEHYQDSVMKEKIAAFIVKGFCIQSNGKQAQLRFMGYEVNENGLADFYFDTEPMPLSESIEFRFDWMMDQLPKQQNKVTFTHNGKKNTAVFLPSKRTEILSLANGK